MLLILLIIVSIKRLLLPGNVYIKPSMVGAMRFERLFLELLSSTIVKFPDERKAKMYERLREFRKNPLFYSS